MKDIDNQTGIQTDKQPHTLIQTNKQTDRQTNKQTTITGGSEEIQWIGEKGDKEGERNVEEGTWKGGEGNSRHVRAEEIKSRRYREKIEEWENTQRQGERKD